jgi:hypothetical protein
MVVDKLTCANQERPSNLRYNGTDELMKKPYSRASSRKLKEALNNAKSAGLLKACAGVVESQLAGRSSNSQRRPIICQDPNSILGTRDLQKKATGNLGCFDKRLRSP